jgi:hypothetical protein
VRIFGNTTSNKINIGWKSNNNYCLIDRTNEWDSNPFTSQGAPIIGRLT